MNVRVLAVLVGLFSTMCATDVTVDPASYFDVTKQHVTLSAEGQTWLYLLRRDDKLAQVPDVVAAAFDCEPGSCEPLVVGVGEELRLSPYKIYYSSRDDGFACFQQPEKKYQDVAVHVCAALERLLNKRFGDVSVELHTPATLTGCRAIWDVLSTTNDGLPIFATTPIWVFLHKVYVRPAQRAAPPLIGEHFTPLREDNIEGKIAGQRLLALGACVNYLLSDSVSDLSSDSASSGSRTQHAPAEQDDVEQEDEVMTDEQDDEPMQVDEEESDLVSNKDDVLEAEA